VTMLSEPLREERLICTPYICNDARLNPDLIDQDRQDQVGSSVDLYGSKRSGSCL
jgi:hypothetical protein